MDFICAERGVVKLLCNITLTEVRSEIYGVFER